jgi:uncharacterized membrane protein
MEILLTILLAFVIYLLITNHKAMLKKISLLEGHIHRFQESLMEIQLKQGKEYIESVVSPVVSTEMPEQEEPVVEPIATVEETKPINEEAFAEKVKVWEERISIISQPIKTSESTISLPKRFEPRPSFFERHPDFEKFVGENLINKIGIAILVLAMGFFVKYAIDNDWVGPAGRVGIGVLFGAILIAIAHRLRNTYRSFSSVLIGGGLAILYFTITLAFHQFHLFNQTTSFIILIVITCFSVALSLLYDKQELAIIALVGGLASPFMVSTGQANITALFIYMILLNAGLLVLAYNKA